MGTHRDRPGIAHRPKDNEKATHGIDGIKVAVISGIPVVQFTSYTIKEKHSAWLLQVATRSASSAKALYENDDDQDIAQAKKLWFYLIVFGIPATMPYCHQYMSTEDRKGNRTKTRR